MMRAFIFLAAMLPSFAIADGAPPPPPDPSKQIMLTIGQLQAIINAKIADAAAQTAFDRLQEQIRPPLPVPAAPAPEKQ